MPRKDRTHQPQGPHFLQGLVNRPGHPLCPRGWLHPLRRADEQLVLQHVAQASQCMADGGLRQAEPLSGPRQVLLLA